MFTRAFDPSVQNRSAGVVGNLLEWYDFAVFAFLAPELGRLFFPQDDQMASLIVTYGIFATGYFMRPLGGILFGHLGDLRGRRRALRLSVFLMAAPTVSIGLLPTHQEIGITAAVLLVLLRLLQGIAVGGELAGSLSYLVEIAPASRRGFLGSLAIATAVGGILLGSATVTMMTDILGQSAMIEWGWRVPFLGGILVASVAFWLRSTMAESVDLERAAEERRARSERTPLLAALREQPGIILVLAAFLPVFTASFYMLFVWMPVYLGKIIQPPVEHASAITTGGAILVMMLIPLSGALSDHLGRRGVALAGTAALALSAYPLFLVVAHRVWPAVLLAQIPFAVLVGLIQGPTPALMAERFPARMRYSAIGFVYNSCVALFGGTAPLVSTWLIRETGSSTSPALYIVLLAVVGTIALLFIKSHSQAGSPFS